MTMLNIFMIFALLAVLASLAFGLVALFRGGEFNKKYGNAAMQWRVILQGLALVIFFILLWATQK